MLDYKCHQSYANYTRLVRWDMPIKHPAHTKDSEHSEHREHTEHPLYLCVSIFVFLSLTRVLSPLSSPHFKPKNIRNFKPLSSLQVFRLWHLQVAFCFTGWKVGSFSCTQQHKMWLSLSRNDWGYGALSVFRPSLSWYFLPIDIETKYEYHFNNWALFCCGWPRGGHRTQQELYN